MYVTWCKRGDLDDFNATASAQKASADTKVGSTAFAAASLAAHDRDYNQMMRLSIKQGGKFWWKFLAWGQNVNNSNDNHIYRNKEAQTKETKIQCQKCPKLDLRYRITTWHYRRRTIQIFFQGGDYWYWSGEFEAQD